MKFSLKPAINSWPLARVVQDCLFVPVGVWGWGRGTGQQLVHGIYDRFIKYKWNNWLQNQGKPSLAFCKLVLNTLWNFMNSLCRKQTAASLRRWIQGARPNPGHSTRGTAMGQEDSQRTFVLLFTNIHLTVISDPETVSDRDSPHFWYRRPS